MSVIEAPVKREATAAPCPVVEEVTAADVLERAADLLGEYGWRQHTFGSKDEGEMCFVGALIEAQRDLGRRGKFTYLFPALRLAGFSAEENRWDVAEWNDKPGRTREEVVAKVREAAKAARA